MRKCFSDGLSPPVRGKLIRPSVQAGIFRSIPARAGETLRGQRLPGLRGVYPRPCGGNASLSPLVSPSAGLSPPVRGKPELNIPLRYRRGSIPARAGETGRLPEFNRQGQVYPRPCGGNILKTPEIMGLFRLSPPVRGKLV